MYVAPAPGMSTLPVHAAATIRRRSVGSDALVVAGVRKDVPGRMFFEHNALYGEEAVAQRAADAQHAEDMIAAALAIEEDKQRALADKHAYIQAVGLPAGTHAYCGRESSETHHVARAPTPWCLGCSGAVATVTTASSRAWQALSERAWTR
jgi:hypothetical protein